MPRTTLSLGARLSLLVALIVVGVVTCVAYLEVRSFEQHIGADLEDSARLGAQSAADALSQRSPPLDPQDVRDTLHDLVAADPAIDAISVIASDHAGHASVFTSTSTEERAEIVDLGGRAIASKTAQTERSATAFSMALPVARRGSYAVAVTVGLDGLLQMRAHALRIALGFVVPTVLFVTILVHLTVRRMVGRPLGAILGTMEEARAGNLASRTVMNRHDELGTIAHGLNEMLDQLERSSQSLQNQVGDATRELVAVRESLGRAERVAALGQVAANVAHQAGTPLNLVSGYIQMIRDDPGTDERTRLKMRTIDEQIQQVTRVLRSMLDHARHPSEPQVGSLAAIIMRVRDVALPRLSRHNVRLKVSIAENLAPVQVDPTQMEMALFNLVTNALDAMPAGGTLSIAAAARPGGIRVEISDTGSGIPPAILDRLFEPWVTTKPLGHGSGLGLAIVRDVVRAQGGTIEASNGTAGAVFVIDLPAADVERNTA